jgi:hypothetical protein
MAPADLSGGHTGIQIVVKYDEETLTLDMNMSDSIATVKAHIHNVTGIPVEDQGIYLEDEKLDDTTPVEQYAGTLLTMWLDASTWFRPYMVIVTKTNTPECYEFMRRGEKVGSIGCRLCWCWMSPACEESHWNSKHKHGKRLRNYTGPPDPNNFREVKLTEEPVENEQAEMQPDAA